jgi:hypothetical protein
VLSVGDRVPETRLWLTPRDEASVPTLAADGPILLLFYLFDWSST